MITAPVAIIIQNQLDATFLFVALTINICTFLTLVLVFIAKVKYLIKHTHEEEEVNETATNETLVLQKKEKYFKILHENQELSDLIRQRQELLTNLEQILNPIVNYKAKISIDPLILQRTNTDASACSDVSGVTTF